MSSKSLLEKNRKTAHEMYGEISLMQKYITFVRCWQQTPPAARQNMTL